MAFTLVYSGEHYFFDIVIGWFYTALVVGGTAALRRYRRSRSQAAPVARERAREPAYVSRSTSAGL
jgi:membrane-associated phospholipid phosphatase